jgi:uncharacterized delta-60 repeat protein
MNKSLLGSLSCAALLAAGACAPATTSGPAKPAGGESPRGLALDTALGANGFAALPLSTTTNDRFMAVATAADGKVYAAGYTTLDGDQAMAVARIDASGKLDSTFGTNGFAVANIAEGGKAGELARGVAVQKDGRVVIAGPFEHDPKVSGDAARDTDIAVVRFDTAGKLDPTFGTAGVAKVDLSTGRITTGTTFVGDSSWGLGLLPGDKPVVLGSQLADAPRTDADLVLFALTTAGAPDTTFGRNGRLVVDMGNTADTPRNLTVQADGRVVATGYAAIEGVVQPILIRTTAAGQLDPTFGKEGVATAKVLAGVAESYAAVQQGENYILAGYGRGEDTAEKVDMIIYRFLANGTYDTAFGTNGVARVDIAKEDDRARNVIVLPDGRILAVGSGKADPVNVNGMVVSLTKDGAVDTTVGQGGNIITDLGGPNDAWYGVAVSADNKWLYLAGYKGVDPNGAGNDDAVFARAAL